MNRLPPGPSFAVLSAMSVLLWFRPLLNTLGLAASDNRYTLIILILPLVVALILRGWSGFYSHVWTPAGAVLVVSLLVACGTRWIGGASDVRLAIDMAALVTWWIASFCFCFGLAALRSFLFPLFFLYWMVPIPKIALDPIVAGLQQGSTHAARFVFSIFRVPITRDGTSLSIPGLDIDVTAECSSIRSSLMLLVTTMVLAYVLLRTPWRRTLIILCAIPLSIAKNGLRIFVIGTLATRVDSSYLTGRLHNNGGIVFFLIALGAIFLLLWFLQRGEHPSPGAALASPPQPTATTS